MRGTEKKPILRVKDGERLEKFLNHLKERFEVEVVEDPELRPTPALRIGNIFYHGIPQHLEAQAFEEILKIAGDAKDEPAEVEIKIFTTPTCRFCKKAVVAAAKLIASKGGLRLRIYDATEFNELAAQYDVTAVPKIVVNDVLFIEAQTTERGYEKLLRRALEHLMEHAQT